MTAHDPADDEGVSEFEQSTDEESIGERVPTAVSRRAKNGTLALLAGGLMLGRAARSIRRSRGRAVLRGIAGAGLLAVGLRQRRSKTGPAPRHSTGEGTGREDVGATDVTIDEPREEPSGAAEIPGESDRTEDEPEDLGIGEETDETGMGEESDETGMGRETDDTGVHGEETEDGDDGQ